MLVFWAAANTGGLAQIFSLPYQPSGSLQSSSAAAPWPTGSGTHLLLAMGAHAQGAFRGAHTLWFLRCGLRPSKVHNPPGASDLGLMPPKPSQECWAARWRGDWSCCCRKIPQSAPEYLSFWENPPAQSCCSIQGRACPLTQPSSLARPGTVRVRAKHGPTLNSPQTAPTVPVCLAPCPYSPLCDFKQPGLSQCCSSLVWQGRVLLTWLSPRSPVVGASLGLQSPCSPRWSQGPLFPEAIPLLSVFSVSSILFGLLSS